MSKIDVFINRKSNSDLLTEDGLKQLKTKITEIEAIYNIIIRSLCQKRNIDTNFDVFKNIKDEITKITSFKPSEICLDINCKNQMFEDSKLKTLIDTMDKTHFLNKACLFRDIKGDYKFDIKFDQLEKPSFNRPIMTPFTPLMAPMLPYTRFINPVVPRMFQRPFPFMTGGSYLNIIDIMKEDLEDQQRCDFCDEWVDFRRRFKSAMKEMITTPNINDTFEVMANSAYLLPSAILDQNRYKQFNDYLQQYKQSHRIH